MTDAGRGGPSGNRAPIRGPSVEMTDLNRPTRFLANMRFRVDIPEIACDLKSLVTPFDAQSSAQFNLTHEENSAPTETLLPEFLGFEFGTAAADDYSYEPRPPSPIEAELSDPESLDTFPTIDDEDYEILDAIDSVMTEELRLNRDTMLMEPRKKKTLPPSLKIADKERWWIEENEKPEQQTQEIHAPRLHRLPRKRKVRTFATRESFIRSTLKGFAKAKKPRESRTISIPTSVRGGLHVASMARTRRAVAVYDVLPYKDKKSRGFCTVNLHNNCVEDSHRLLPFRDQYSTQISENVLLKEFRVEPKTWQEAEVNRAIGFDNKYLGLIAPCYVQTSTDRRQSIVDHEADYVWIREYFYTKKEGEDSGKWRLAIRLDKEKKVAELIPIGQRFITRKQKLRSIIPRPISVLVQSFNVMIVQRGCCYRCRSLTQVISSKTR